MDNKHNNLVHEKEKQRDRMLQEIKYYEKRIEDFKINPICRYNASSSDSEDECITLIDTGPSLAQLKLERAMLKTCLQATQELTGLQILQTETRIIDDPVILGETPVKEAGTWKEVIAECKIDLVPFSIMFYTHTPNRKFAPTWYRGLRVTVVKAAHEAELSRSILFTVKKPYEAITVLKKYSQASRSRRNTLAQLADRYETCLFMQPLDEGGYQLKCENVLEMSWCLENKRSPFLPFRHRMKLDLEYVEESYIDTITKAYNQLSNPTITTDERTDLLSEIISTCLKAKESLSKSAQAELDMAKTTSEKENEVMAPPKTVPRRSKSKAVRNENVSRNNDLKISESSSRVTKDNDMGDRDNGQHNIVNRISNDNKQKSKTEESAHSASNRAKQTQRIDLTNSDASKKSLGKRNIDVDNSEPLEHINGNAKRNKINNNNAAVSNKESSGNTKKASIANVKNTQSANNKQIPKGISSRTKEAEAENTGDKNVANVINKNTKVGEKKSGAVSKNKTSINGKPGREMTKSVVNSKINNVNQQNQNSVKLKTNKDEVVSGSGDKIKQTGTQKHSNVKKPVLPLKIKNNRNSLSKATRKSVGKKINSRKFEKENNVKVTKIPQKFMTSHSSGHTNSPKFKATSNFNLNMNTRKPSNIPRLAKPGTSKK